MGDAGERSALAYTTTSVFGVNSEWLAMSGVTGDFIYPGAEQPADVFAVHHVFQMALEVVQLAFWFRQFLTNANQHARSGNCQGTLAGP